MHVTKGDTVRGDARRRQGQGREGACASSKTGRVMIDGVNIVKRHRKARSGRRAERHHRVAGADPRVERDAARSRSRARPTRVRRRIDDDGTKERIAVQERRSDPARTAEDETMANQTRGREAGRRRSAAKAQPRPEEGEGARRATRKQAAGRRTRAPTCRCPPPRLKAYLHETVRRQAEPAVRLHEPAPGPAAREDRDQRRCRRSDQAAQGARRGRRRAGDDHRPAAGAQEGEEVDRQLRAARRARRSARR